MKYPELSILSKGLCLIIVVVQLFDIAIHAASDQLEPLRVASNVIVLLWVVAVVAGWLRGRFRPISITAISTYLLLNLIFLAQEGVTNPNQGGALRTTLFLLVFLTMALSTLLTVQHRRGIH